MKTVRKLLRGQPMLLAALLGAPGCTDISRPENMSLAHFDCYDADSSGKCGCFRKKIEVIAPNMPASGLATSPYKDLDAYLNTAPLPNVLFGMGDFVANSFLNPGFYVMNRYRTYVTRGGSRINNAFALKTSFNIEIPNHPDWLWLDGTVMRLAVLSGSGGVKVTTTAGGATQVVIDKTQYQRSRLHCSYQDVTLEIGKTMSVELISNIADGDFRDFSAKTYSYTDPVTRVVQQTVGGAYGGLDLLGGFTWPAATKPETVPWLNPDLSSCDLDFYDEWDPLKPPGARTRAELLAPRFFFTVPKELTQLTPADRATYGLPVCGVGE